MTSSPTPPRPLLLLILDGFGHRQDPTDNAIAAADTPNWDRLWSSRPRTLINTFGRHVGLPEGQMGNSEVGHMNLGAGRIVWQDLSRIEAAIADGSFDSNQALNQAISAARDSGGTVHVLALVSPGGVHSHQAQVFQFLRLAAARGAGPVAVHAFLDGRDTPPRSAEASLRKLAAVCAETGARIASVSGRYYAMDRDQRWDRVEKAWRVIAEADASAGNRFDDALAALQAAYQRGIADEFVEPAVIGAGAPVRDGDAVVFMNFRADRARQLSQVFVEEGFDAFSRRQPALSSFVTLTRYQDSLPATVAFPPQTMANTLPEVLAAHGLAQLRIAETEKYAHVTFFFSGGREAVYPGEERILVPSPKVATYDLQPEMSCPEVVARLKEAIASERFDVIICNLANPDMVGHSGDFDAAVKAVETVDWALGELIPAVAAAGGETLVTADHGNLEMMRDPETGQPHTAHTIGPVPLVYVGERELRLRDGGALRDIAPTLLALLGLPPPEEMTGSSLIEPAPQPAV
ncbi:MAG: 2,3-bisphosphoglycerate-independent phosphoglycerate mutase [Xanthomonadales bacterium]|nr:2,3-bisphosphoglycerate-independent phosphoglycerate mutase [Xanthomonadales bacterium]